MKKVKYSVITCDRGGLHLTTALQGLRWQTYPDRELIVVDYGNKKPLRVKGAKVLRWSKPGPWNHSRALNIGIANARGEYLVLTNSDCLMSPGLLATVDGLLAEDDQRHILWERFDLYKLGLEHLKNLNANQRAGVFNETTRGAWLAAGYGWRHPHTACGDFLVVRREVLVDLGGYDERCENWGFYDTDMSHRLAQTGCPQHWGDTFDLIHLFHPVQKDQDATWKHNEQACWPDIQAENWVRNGGAGHFDQYREA